jgi:tRNA (guanine-N7-)-methyltransferase
MSATRADVLARLGPLWFVDDVGPPLSLDVLFGKPGPVVVEIGIGLGEALIDMSAADPATNVIGVDVHTPGMAKVLATIEADGRTNVRLVHGDALLFLERLPEASLAGVRVFFPDPWPKPGQHHKRIISTERLNVIVSRIEQGGWLHLATDIDHYAAQMIRVCGEHPALTGGVIDRPSGFASRPITRYERKGLDAGRSATDLWYLRR